nr:putative ribonuclease H-like domain-containing protein [Tanacetum cinerariifolium]
PNTTNNTNSSNTASLSDTAVSPNFGIAGKSSFVDPSKYPDDLDMPKLEHIVYSDDEEDIGAENDLSNLEINISVNPIPTTRVHKDHPVNQIIGDLNSAPQTRSMARVGHTQEEGIDYDEYFAPVARIKAIQMFLAYACFMGFMVYQMDVKSDFLYETIEEEVYVYQPLGFEDPNYPDKVYKVVKVLHGLYQAPRTWYETLANYLLENVFQKGKIAQTLFIKKKKGDILLVYMYVDDIIFGSTNKELCKAFEKLIKDKVKMSSMRELTFFLGLQVKKKDDGIFISKDKYVAEILRKFGFTDVKSDSTPIETEKPLLKDPDASTPIETKKPLLKDPDSEDVDVHIYRSMIGSLMYLTLSKPDIMFADPVPIPHATPPQYQPSTPHASPPQEQPTTTYDSTMPLLTTLMETCASLSQKVAELEQDKHTQALEILQLKKRVKKLEKKNRSKSSGFKRKIEAIDADEDITLVDVEKDEEEVAINVEPQGRINQEEVNAASKDVSAAEPIVFNDEDVTMIMAQTLIKLKVEKAKLLDEHIAQKLHDEEVQKAVAKDKQEKDDIERAQVQERHLDNIRKYQNLKKKPVSIAQAKKNMIIYLKDMDGYKIEHFRGMTYDKVRPIFKREYKKVQTLFKTYKDVEEPKKKRVVMRHCFKKVSRS